MVPSREKLVTAAGTAKTGGLTRTEISLVQLRWRGNTAHAQRDRHGGIIPVTDPD